MSEPILVKREENASRLETKKLIGEKVNDGQLLLFPEGTCTNRTMILRLKLGAFYPGKPIQGIFVKYNCFNRK